MRLFDATTLVVGSMIGSSIFLALLILSGIPFYAIWRSRAGTTRKIKNHNPF